MRLKNKKTGEIGWLYEHSLVQDIIIVYDVKGIVGKYKSITELCEEWEDYEEPKLHWYIYGAEPFEVDEQNMDKDYVAELKSIGNYFETEEEAEEAVEKLEAVRRLKDKGFKITGWAIYPLPDEFLDGKRIWYNTVLRGRIDFEIPLDNSKDIDKELEHFVTDEEGGEE